MLDKAGTIFTRIWCCYEVTNALEWATGRLGDQASDFKYDLYTCYSTPFGSQRTAGITDGLAAVDNHSEQRKAKREMQFPMEALANALNVRLHKGQATVEDDRSAPSRLEAQARGRSPLSPWLTAAASVDVFAPLTRGQSTSST